MINALYNNPFFAAMFSGFDPYLPLLGNPLIFLSPYNIAFALGYPMDIGSYVAYLSQTFFYIGLDLTAAFAAGNPATIGFTILFTTVEAVGTIITDTIALLKTLLEQTAVLLTVFVPLVTAPLVTLAAGGLAPIGLAGLAGLSALPPAPPVAPPITPPVLALPPSIPTTASSPTPAPVEATAPAATPGAPPPSATPPTLSGAGMTTSMGAPMPAGMENFAYLVGDLSAAAGAAAVGRARKKAAEPGSAAAPAAAAAPKERDKPQRRRRAKVQMLGRGYEFMDLEDEGERWRGDGLGYGRGAPGVRRNRHQQRCRTGGRVDHARRRRVRRRPAPADDSAHLGRRLTAAARIRGRRLKRSDALCSATLNLSTRHAGAVVPGLYLEVRRTGERAGTALTNRFPEAGERHRAAGRVLHHPPMS